MYRLMKLLSVFLATLSLQSVFAAQLVDSIPTILTENWSICTHFEKKTTSCEIKSTPETTKQRYDQVRQYVYRKDFIVSSELQQSTLGLWLDMIDDVDEVRLNNKLIGKTGSFPPQFQSGFRHKRLYLIPSIYIKFNQFNHLEVKTFSSVNQPGLGRKPIIIGDYFDIVHQQQEMDYTYIICISILLLLTVFQMFYYFMVQGSNETIYLSWALLSFALVAFIRSNIPLHIGLNLSSVFKVEMFILSFSFIALSFFALRFFELTFRRRYVITSVIVAILGMISILYPNPLHARYLSEISYLIIAILSIFLLTNTLIFSIQKRKKYVLVMGVFFVGISLAVSFDALSQTKALFDWQLAIAPFILPVTTAITGTGMALTITHKYWHIFKGATYDHLTQTLLRPAFFQRLTEEMHRCQVDKSNLMLAVINLEEIKNIGLSYGQIAKNKMLISVSEKITKLLAISDLVCHCNDDEFCFTTIVESHKQAENQLRLIHRALVNTQQIIDKDTEIYVNAKMAGVLYNPDRHLSISQLLQDANYGLAKVKSQKNQDFMLLDPPSNTA